MTYKHHVTLFSLTKYPAACYCSTTYNADSGFGLFSGIRHIFFLQILKTSIFFFPLTLAISPVVVTGIIWATIISPF